MQHMLSFRNTRIHNKLIVVFIAFSLSVFGISGWFHYWQTEKSLEEQLGNKLIANALLIASELNADLFTRLAPGDESSRTYRNFTGKLVEKKDLVALNRVYVFDRSFKSYLDTKPNIAIGHVYTFLQFNEAEIADAAAGKPTASVLFEGPDGNLYKTAFAPIYREGEPVAFIAVEASATFLAAVKQIETNILITTAIGILISIVIGFFLAKNITRPIYDLVGQAEKIGAGELQTRIFIRTQDEIGFLASTLEKMRENLVKKDTFFKTMLSGIAHELKNPISGIEIYANLLGETLKEQNLDQNAVNRILQELGFTKRIINDFIDFTNPTKAHPESCLIAPVIEEALDVLHADRVEWDIRIDASLRVFADRVHLRQVAMNIIENSIQSVNGSGKVSIDSTKKNGLVQITVRDNGPGIDGRLLEKVFEPFFTTKESGSGLGLAIAKRLVEENKGFIEIDSHAGMGTECRVFVPGSETSI